MNAITARILIVEDEPDMAMGLHDNLQFEGYEVLVAGDGLSAVTMAQRNRPAAILLDIGLPAGDGFTVLKRLKGLTHLRHVPVVIITAKKTRREREAIAASEAVAMLEKPITEETLLATVQGCLGDYAPARATACPQCGRSDAGAPPDLPVGAAATRGREGVMALDRNKVARNAEKLVARGKLNAAIDEYRA